MADDTLEPTSLSVEPPTAEPLPDTQTWDIRPIDIKQTQDTVGRMLRYAVTNPAIQISNELINNSVKSIGISAQDYTHADEVLLWQVYAQLAQLVSPASDTSIQIVDGLKDMASRDMETTDQVAGLKKLWGFFGFSTINNKLVRRCHQDLSLITCFLLLFVGLYVISQCYIALLSDTLGHSSDLLDELKTLQTSELLMSGNAQTSPSTDRPDIELLNAKLYASSQALVDLTKPLGNLSFPSLSPSTLAALDNCSTQPSMEQKALLKCIALERKYASAAYTVLSRYFLPLILGFIGATAYVTRNTLFHLTNNSYVPSPRGMLTMRLCLGGLLGAISGIFVSAGSSETEGFNISLTLTALLMGYSVEVAFSLFDSAIDRLKAWTKALRGSTSATTTATDTPKPQ